MHAVLWFMRVLMSGLLLVSEGGTRDPACRSEQATREPVAAAHLQVVKRWRPRRALQLRIRCTDPRTGGTAGLL